VSCCERGSRIALLAEVDKSVWPDALRSLNPKIVVMMRLLTTGADVRQARRRETSYGSLSSILIVDMVLLKDCSWKRRLKFDLRLWSLISSRLKRVVSSLLVAVVWAVLSAAERLRCVLLWEFVKLGQWTILKKVDWVASMVHYSMWVLSLSNSCKQSLRERKGTRRLFIFHIESALR
jgi:hypothetical protein